MGNEVFRDCYRHRRLKLFNHDNLGTKDSILNRLKNDNKKLDTNRKLASKDKNKEDSVKIKNREIKLRPGSIYNGRGIQMNNISQTKTNYLKNLISQKNKMNCSIRSKSQSINGYYGQKMKEVNKGSNNKNINHNNSSKDILKSNNIKLRMLRTMF